MKQAYVLPLLAAVCLAAGAPAPALARDAALAKAKYLDAKLPADKRVADLLARMTLEEKVAQLTAYWFPKSCVLRWRTTRRRRCSRTAWERSRARRRTRTARRTSTRARKPS